MIESLFEKIAFDREIVQSEQRLQDDEFPLPPIPGDEAAEESPFVDYLNRCQIRDAERNRRQYLQAQRYP
jgi:hypothetical protein